jgi:uncharacterized protein with von Willebrand factor type A (vWA) domain
VNNPPSSSGHFLHNLVLFGRLLRQLGLDVNPGRMIDLVQALDYIEIGRKNDFYHAIRCHFVHHKDDIPLFDLAFELFWRKPADAFFDVDLPANMSPRAPKEPVVVPPPLEQPIQADAENEEPEKEEEEEELLVVEVTRTYSQREVLRQKDFGELTADEIQAVKEMMAQLTFQLGQRRTRRQQPGRGRHIDFRRSLRRSLRYGGEFMEWSERKPKYRPRPLIVVADISGSMERYTRLLLHFIYSLTKGLDQPVEAFVFSTHLTRITRQLLDQDIELAMKNVSRAVNDWSGGTRIGEALKRFNYDWARRVLGRGAVVLLISDGWDRGDPELLGQEIGRLQRSCHRLIWLNPLLGSPEYEPLTRGMQAALPYIDDFLPVHSLASLEELVKLLATLDSHRPSRRQQLGALQRNDRIHVI